MTDPTPTTLNCPSCGAPLEVDGTSSLVRCNFCKNISLVPGVQVRPGGPAPGSLDEIRRLAQAGNLLEAIRLYRATFGSGLKEARDAVDVLVSGRTLVIQQGYAASQSPEATSQVLEEVKELLRSQNKIAAIKRYREVQDVSLAQAKEVVDRVEAALTGTPLPERPIISGQPATQFKPVSSGKWLGCGILLTILLIVGGILAFVFTRVGSSNPFTPRLIAVEPALLITSAPGVPPEVVSLFYDPNKDTRLIGLVEGDSGKLRWQAAPLEGDGFADAMVDGGDLVYVANDATLLAYRKSDGGTAWQTQMPDRLNYGPVPLLVVAGRVITLNVDETIQGYDAATGALVWDRRLNGNDNTLRLMGGSLAVLDYPSADSYTYSLFLLDPLDGSQQRLITPTCQVDTYSSDTLGVYSGMVYIPAEDALYLVYDSYNGCIQRLQFSTGRVVWQVLTGLSYSFSSDGFISLDSGRFLYFAQDGQLERLEKTTGSVETLLTNEDYEFLPLAISGDTLLLRAKRTRGTQRFEIWGLDAATGNQVWQQALPGAEPIDPPDDMIGLVDNTDSGWTSRLLPAGWVLVKFQGAPNQVVLSLFDPATGSLLNEKTVPLPQISGDFYSVPTVIGWQEEVAFLLVESHIYALNVLTGEVLFTY